MGYLVVIYICYHYLLFCYIIDTVVGVCYSFHIGIPHYIVVCLLVFVFNADQLDLWLFNVYILRNHISHYIALGFDCFLFLELTLTFVHTFLHNLDVILFNIFEFTSVRPVWWTTNKTLAKCVWRATCACVIIGHQMAPPNQKERPTKQQTNKMLYHLKPRSNREKGKYLRLVYLYSKHSKSLYNIYTREHSWFEECFSAWLALPCLRFFCIFSHCAFCSSDDTSHTSGIYIYLATHAICVCSYQPPSRMMRSTYIYLCGFRCARRARGPIGMRASTFADASREPNVQWYGALRRGAVFGGDLAFRFFFVCAAAFV